MKTKKCILLSFLCLFLSCEFKREIKKSDKNVESDDEVVTGETGLLSAQDLQIGKTACSALQNKIFKFNTVNLGKDFLFQISTKSCPPSSVLNSEMAILRVSQQNSQLKFNVVSNYTGNYFDEIVTSQDATLSYFCPKITAIPTQDVPNYVDPALNLRTKVRFKGTNANPVVEINYFVKRNGVDYSLDRKMSLAVDVNNGDLEGNITDQTMLTLCPNQKDFFEIKQTFTP